jgi:hypothetical protein
MSVAVLLVKLRLMFVYWYYVHGPYTVGNGYNLSHSYVRLTVLLSASVLPPFQVVYI